MEIAPASLAQVRAGRDGRNILIEDDVLDVAKRLKEIDDSLRLRWNEGGEYFVVYQLLDEGDTEKLVLTARELDDRILKRVQEIVSPGYDFLAEIDRMDAEAQKEKDRRFAEQTGEIGERLAHAVRKDVEAQNRIIVPRGLDGNGS